MSEIIYFDYNSTTSTSNEVLAKMALASDLPLNASATHQLGQKATAFIEEARENVKNALNGQNYEVIFTSSSTEASNTIMQGVAEKNIILSKLEHAAVYNCQPKNKQIIEVNILENGVIDPKDIEKRLLEVENGNFLLCLMIANNETGAIQPVKEVSKLVHQKGGLIYSDLSQGVGKINIDLEYLNLDFASFSSHKIEGPQGAAAILIRKGLNLEPLIYGGGQEKSKRSGTHNIAGIIGFGKACKLINVENFQKTSNLRDFLEEKVQNHENITIFSSEVERLPNTSYISIKGKDNQTQLINLDLNGICVSAGAACSSGTVNESRILKAMNVKKEYSSSAIRVSLGPKNTKKEIDKFVEIYLNFAKN